MFRRCRLEATVLLGGVLLAFIAYAGQGLGAALTVFAFFVGVTILTRLIPLNGKPVIHKISRETEQMFMQAKSEADFVGCVPQWFKNGEYEVVE